MINSRSLNDLRPAARDKAREFKAQCKRVYGIDILIYCTYRDEAQQNFLYASGRTRPGRKLTNARGGKSWHNHRCAWDCVPMEGGKTMWGDRASYRKMGKIAAMLGIVWAGNWRAFKETAHFQFTNGHDMQHFRDGGTLR